MKIVQFSDGTYGVRKPFLFVLGHVYLDRYRMVHNGKPYFWYGGEYVYMHARFKSLEDAKSSMQWARDLKPSQKFKVIKVFK